MKRAFERTGGFMIYDLTDPSLPVFLEYLNTGEQGPEGLEFIPAEYSPTGMPVLVVGYEVAVSVGVYGIVPESNAILSCEMFALTVGVWLLRRRR